MNSLKRRLLYNSPKIVQILAIEIYEHLRRLSPTILGEVLKINEKIPYLLRMRNELYARNPKAVGYSTEVLFLSPKIWALRPNGIKESNSFSCFLDYLHRIYLFSFMSVTYCSCYWLWLVEWCDNRPIRSDFVNLY